MAISPKHNLVKWSVPGKCDSQSGIWCRKAGLQKSCSIRRSPSHRLRFKSSASSTSCGAMARSRLHGLSVVLRDRNSDVRRMTDGVPVFRAEVHDTAQNPRSKAALGAKIQGHDSPGDSCGLMLTEPRAWSWSYLCSSCLITTSPGDHSQVSGSGGPSPRAPVLPTGSSSVLMTETGRDLTWPPRWKQPHAATGSATRVLQGSRNDVLIFHTGIYLGRLTTTSEQGPSATKTPSVKIATCSLQTNFYIFLYFIYSRIFIYR